MEDLIQKAAEDLLSARYTIALTGAGISTESGIPDFRGPDGIWSKNPEAEMLAFTMYDQFLADPKRFWQRRLDPRSPMMKFYSIFGKINRAQPNPGHYALAELEKMGILKCIITQNVDGLHQKAGSREVVEFHGGINKFRCTACNKRFSEDELDLEKLEREGNLPPYCQCGGVIKDDGVFFKEPIPTDVIRRSRVTVWKCDLMLICGTSAEVLPFANLPKMADKRTRIIEINADPTHLTGQVSNYLIQGKTGEILPQIVEKVKIWENQTTSEIPS